MMIKSVLRSALPTDLILLCYMVLTLPLVLIQFILVGGDAILPIYHIICIFILVAITLFRWKYPHVSTPLKPLGVLYPLMFLGFLYKETDYINNLLFSQNLDFWALLTEEGLFGFQPSVVFSEVASWQPFAELMYFGYFAYYLMLIGIPVLILIKKGYAQAQKGVFIMITSFVIYYLIFIILPVSGPQFYLTGVDPIPQGYVFGSIIRFLQASGEAPTAAFPSSHVAICLILIYLAYKEFKTKALWLLPIALLLIFSTVYIRAHYAIDILAAFITAPAVYFLAKLTLSKLFKHDPINC